MKSRWFVRAILVLTVVLCIGTACYTAQAWWAKQIASEECLQDVWFSHEEGLCLFTGYACDHSIPVLPWWRECPWYGVFGRDATLQRKRSWLPRRTFREILVRATRRDFGDDPAAWEGWFKAHPDVVWDSAQGGLVNPVDESVTYRLPEGASPVRIHWKMNLEGFSRNDGIQTMLRSEGDLRSFLGGGTSRFPIDTLIRWNAITFPQRMALVLAPDKDWKEPTSIQDVFEWQGDLCFTDVRVGKTYTSRTPVEPVASPAVIPAPPHAVGVVLGWSDRKLRFVPSSGLPKTEKRTVLYPDLQ